MAENPSAPTLEHTYTLEQIVAYLDGSGDLDGFWFGEGPSGRRYWWRSHLRAALQVEADERARLQAENERLRQIVQTARTVIDRRTDREGNDKVELSAHPLVLRRLWEMLHVDAATGSHDDA
jgi:hypothetical protein